MNICQVADRTVNIGGCGAVDDNFIRCEVIGPHSDSGHWVSPHTIRHAQAGNGYRCSAIEDRHPLFPPARWSSPPLPRILTLRGRTWSRLTRRWRKDVMLCPVCDGCFWTMRGVAIHRHPSHIVKSRFGGMTPVATCDRCHVEFSLMLAGPWPLEPSTGRAYV